MNQSGSIFGRKHSGGRDGHRDPLLVESALRGDHRQAAGGQRDGEGDRRDADRVQAGGGPLHRHLLLRERPGQHRAHVPVLSRLVHQPLPQRAFVACRNKTSLHKYLFNLKVS